MPWFLQVVNSTGSVSLADRGRITTGLEYYFGAFGTTVTLDEVINQVSTYVSRQELTLIPRGFARRVEDIHVLLPQCTLSGVCFGSLNVNALARGGCTCRTSACQAGR